MEPDRRVINQRYRTGTTGYIGGDALYRINEAHPDWEITCLVRNSEKGSKVAAQYPKVKLVYGDLDSADVIEEEAKKADIVYRENRSRPNLLESTLTISAFRFCQL